MIPNFLLVYISKITVVCLSQPWISHSDLHRPENTKEKLSNSLDRKHKGNLHSTQAHMPLLYGPLLSSPCPVRCSHLTDIHHLWFPHRECTQLIQHEEERLVLHKRAMEIIGVEFIRTYSFSQERGELFSSGKERTHYNHGRQAGIHHSCRPHQGRSKCYRGCDDEQRLWYCTPGQKVMRLRRWKMEGRGSQAVFSWIAHYTRVEEGQYVRRQNSHWLPGAYWTLASIRAAWCLLLGLGETTRRQDFLPCMWLLKVPQVRGWGSIRIGSKKHLDTPGKVRITLVPSPPPRELSLA